jgi:hypothetical protein
METTLKTQIEEFLKSLNIDNLEIMDYVDIEEIDLSNAFDSIYGQIDDAGGNGFTLENINSELLASLLATQKVSEDFYDKETDIDNFFNSL